MMAFYDLRNIAEMVPNNNQKGDALVTEDPVISVIMPVLNCMPYLPEAVDSILQQSYSNFEFIIVDDGSDDGGLEYLQALTDTRIQLLSTGKKQSGAGNARNIAINHARGRYIALMDGDDIASPNRLERLLECMEAHPELVMCGSDIMLFQQENKSSYALKHINHETLLLAVNKFFAPSAMLRHDVIKMHKIRYPDFSRGQDVAFAYAVACHGRVMNVKGALYRYRRYDVGKGLRNKEALAKGFYLSTQYMLQDFLGRMPTDKELTLHRNMMSPYRMVIPFSLAQVGWFIVLALKLKTWRGRYMLLDRAYFMLKYYVMRVLKRQNP